MGMVIGMVTWPIRPVEDVLATIDAAADGQSSRLRIWNADLEEPLKSIVIPHVIPPNRWLEPEPRLCFSPDGQQISVATDVGDWGSKAFIIDVATGETLAEFEDVRGGFTRQPFRQTASDLASSARNTKRKSWISPRGRRSTNWRPMAVRSMYNSHPMGR